MIRRRVNQLTLCIGEFWNVEGSDFNVTAEFEVDDNSNVIFGIGINLEGTRIVFSITNY